MTMIGVDATRVQNAMMIEGVRAVAMMTTTADHRGAGAAGLATRNAMPKRRGADGTVDVPMTTTRTVVATAVGRMMTTMAARVATSADGTVTPKAILKRLVAVGTSGSRHDRAGEMTMMVIGLARALARAGVVGSGILAGMPKRRGADGTIPTTDPVDGMATGKATPKPPAADGTTRIIAPAVGLATRKDILALPGKAGTTSRDDDAVEGTSAAP